MFSIISNSSSLLEIGSDHFHQLTANTQGLGGLGVFFVNTRILHIILGKFSDTTESKSNIHNSNVRNHSQISEKTVLNRLAWLVPQNSN